MILQASMGKYICPTENGWLRVSSQKEMDNIGKYGPKLLRIIDM